MKWESMAEDGEHAFTIICASFTGSLQTLPLYELMNAIDKVTFPVIKNTYNIELCSTHVFKRLIQ